MDTKKFPVTGIWAEFLPDLLQVQGSADAGLVTAGEAEPSQTVNG